MDCVVFMFYFCIRLRIYVFFNVGGKIRPYFVQIKQNKALFWNVRKENINRNINKTQTITQTRFVSFCNVCVCTCVWFMFYLCREKNKTLCWAKKTLFYPSRKRNANRNIKKTASSRNFWICRGYAFCFRIWSRRNVCGLRRPVQVCWPPTN